MAGPSTLPQAFQEQCRQAKEAYDLLLQTARPVLQYGTLEEDARLVTLGSRHWLEVSCFRNAALLLLKLANATWHSGRRRLSGQASKLVQVASLDTCLRPSVRQPSGGRPAYSLIQLYRCMVLRLGGKQPADSDSHQRSR